MVQANPNPVRTHEGNKVPLPGLLPNPNDRVFDNSNQAKPVKKRATLDVKFGDLNTKNFE